MALWSGFQAFLVLAVIYAPSNVQTAAPKTTCRYNKGIDIFPPKSLALEKKWVMKLTTSSNDQDIGFTYLVDHKDPYHGLLIRYNVSDIAFLEVNIIRHNGLALLYDLVQQAGELIKVVAFRTSSPRYFCYVICGGENPDLTTTLRCYGGVGSTIAQLRKAIADSGIDLGTLKVEATKVH